MSTVVKPKKPRGPLQKKATPKSKAAAQKLTAAEELQQREQELIDRFNAQVKIWDFVRFHGKIVRTVTAAGMHRGVPSVFLEGMKGTVLLGEIEILGEQPVQATEAEVLDVDGSARAWLEPIPVEFDEVTDYRLEWLARHPLNRVPRPEDVRKITGSLQSEGQLEPIVVRELEGDDGTHFQILSGETRWLAAQELGWTTIAGRVARDLEDARALELLAHFNGERTDLDPIQKARLVESLCKPIEEGGAGNTREQAARAVGLEHGASASNLLRLLTLPKIWQDRVAAGELPESFARLLVPLAKAPRLLAQVEEEWDDHQMCEAAADTGDVRRHDDRFANRADLVTFIQDLIEDETRPVDPGVTWDYRSWILEGAARRAIENLDWQQREQPMLFELTDDLREKLEIIEVQVTVGEGKKKRTELQQRATNVDLYDKLNIPLIVKKVAEKTKQKASKAAAKDEKKVAAKKALTPAQQKVAAHLRNEQLKQRITAWRHRWLCDLVADQIHAQDLSAFTQARDALLAWMMVTQVWGREELGRAALESLGAQLRKDQFGSAEKLWEIFAKGFDDLDANEDSALTAMAVFALRRPDSNPKCPALRNVIDDLAGWCHINLEGAWLDLQHPEAGEDAMARFESFLQLHQSDQLDALGKEWDVFLEGAKGKAAKINLLLPLAGVRTRPLPKSIKPLPGAKPAEASATKKPAKKK